MFSGAFRLTFVFGDVGYRRIALGFAEGNIIMVFADRQCGEARRRPTAAGAPNICCSIYNSRTNCHFIINGNTFMPISFATECMFLS
jgi:hypothetical protein